MNLDFEKAVILIKAIYVPDLTDEQVQYLVSHLIDKETCISPQDAQYSALRLYLRAASNSPVLNAWLKETLPQMPWNKEATHA